MTAGLDGTPVATTVVRVTDMRGVQIRTRPRVGPLTRQFLALEMGERERTELLALAAEAKLDNEYVTYEAFNLLLEFDKNSATVEDELHPGVSEQVPLDDLLAAVRWDVLDYPLD